MCNGICNPLLPPLFAHKNMIKQFQDVVACIRVSICVYMHMPVCLYAWVRVIVSCVCVCLIEAHFGLFPVILSFPPAAVQMRVLNSAVVAGSCFRVFIVFRRQTGERERNERKTELTLSLTLSHTQTFYRLITVSPRQTQGYLH